MTFEASCKECDSNFIKWESIGQPSLLESFPGNALSSQNKLGNILTPLFVVLNKVMHHDKLDIIDWLRLTQFADQNVPCLVCLRYSRTVKLQVKFHILLLVAKTLGTTAS